MGCFRFIAFAIVLVFAIVFIPFTIPLLVVVIICYIPYFIFTKVIDDD